MAACQHKLLKSALCHQHQRFYDRRHVRCRAVRTADAVIELLSWANSSKVSTSKLTTAPSLTADARLLVAAKDLSAGEAILTVPDNLWLSSQTVQQSPYGKYVADLEPWLQLSLYLLLEKNSPVNGSAQAYISTLPSNLETPLFWSDEELSLLEGTQLLQNMLAYRYVVLCWQAITQGM